MFNKDFNTNHWLRESLFEMGVPENFLSWTTLAIDVTILILVAVLVDIIARKVVLKVVKTLVAKSKTEIDDVFFENHVFRGLAHLLPALVVLIGAPIVLRDFPTLLTLVTKVSYLLMVVVVLLVFNSLLNSIHFLLRQNPIFKDKPILSYIQVAKIVGYVIASILIISTVIGKSPVVVLSAFGAVAAVLLFVFKDTILGLVASVQISVNDLVRVGDWISMERFGADGDVLDISLSTIKVQNWDKTISMIPTYMFTADSFKNWRGMQESGGRRVKRAINIKMSSVKFCNPEMIERFKKFELLGQYLNEREQEISTFNNASEADKTYPINGRHLTNIGVFRAYTDKYVRSNAYCHKKLTTMVRQLSPSSEGIPIEVYFFTNTTNWEEYESIQSDIFDHLLASVRLFDLEVFEKPTGADFQKLVN